MICGMNWIWGVLETGALIGPPGLSLKTGHLYRLVVQYRRMPLMNKCIELRAMNSVAEDASQEGDGLEAWSETLQQDLQKYREYADM